MQLITLLALGTALTALVLYKALLSYRAQNDPRLPPGPTRLPFIGRIHDLPIQHMWLKFMEWADVYGREEGYYMTEMLGAKFLIITKEKVAEDLLVRRAKINSDRPEMKSLFDSKSSTGTGEYLPLMGKNQYWARQRKLTHSYLTEASNAHYHGTMHHEAKRLLHALLAAPQDFHFLLEDMASRIMCTLTWDDPSHSTYLTPSAWGLLTQMSPAGPITNVITPLWDYLPEPVNPWKIAERKRHDEQGAWWLARLREVKQRMADGTQRSCFTRQFLEREGKGTGIESEYEAACVLGMLPLVGVFTVAGPLNYFLVAMVHHPEWQERAAREIDEVLGGQRPPEVGDASRLPVLRACIKETMRWRPNVPTGVAHEAEEDFEYCGHLIPKGTRLLPLDWAFLRNPEKYPDPLTYRPERWLSPSYPTTYKEPLSQYPTLKGMSSFGWGQRQCLGMTLTQDELVVACGALLWAFELRRRTDSVSGEEVPVPTDRSNSLLIIKPDPFEMEFRVRSEERRAEVVRLWGESEAKERREREEFLAANRKGPVEMEETEEKQVKEEESVVELVASAMKMDEKRCSTPWTTTVEVKA